MRRSDGLEYWDPQRRKWVLYRSTEQHGEDCARYPFQSIPRSIFLDTNVINILVKHAPHVFEQEPIPPEYDRTLAIDIEALMHVFYVGFRAEWHLVGSPQTLEEISRTKNEDLRGDLTEYALGIVNRDLQDEECRRAVDFGQRLADAPLVSALPDLADRELLGNAIGFGCDAFCTCDRSTIINKRHLLPKLPLRIITPAEWWFHVKPWAGLWG
jgi:hypothetical protein